MKPEQEYVKMSSACPKCGSNDIDADYYTEVEGNMAFQDIHCNSCEFNYYDKYELVGYGYDEENQK